MSKYAPKDIADKATKDFRYRLTRESQILMGVARRSDISTPHTRPLNHMEQSALRAMYCFREFVPLAKEALAYRLRAIPNSTQRLGMMRWAAGSLFDDVIALLDEETARRFAINAQRTEMVERQKSIGVLEPWTRLVWEEDLATIAEAAWRGTCQMCDKTGIEARKCPLKKAFDKMQILDPSDGSAGCWWKEG